MFVIHKYPGIPKTSISTVSLHDRNLTPTAAYIHLLMITSWNEEQYLSVSSICSMTGLGRDRVREALHCLENAHYVIRKRLRIKGRLADAFYNVYEIPYDFYAKPGQNEGGNDYANYSC